MYQDRKRTKEKVPRTRKHSPVEYRKDLPPLLRTLPFLPSIQTLQSEDNQVDKVLSLFSGSRPPGEQWEPFPLFRRTGRRTGSGKRRVRVDSVVLDRLGDLVDLLL